MYLQSSLLPTSNDVFFTAGTSHWTTGSSMTSVSLSQNASDIYDICGLFLSFSVIAIFHATLSRGRYNGRRFTYSNIIRLITSIWVCGTLTLLIFTVIKLGHNWYKIYSKYAYILSFFYLINSSCISALHDNILGKMKK